MTADQEIERLDSEIERLLNENPQVYGILRITNTALRGCTKSKWQAHKWTVRDDEVHKIMNGDDDERRDALLSLLRNHYIHKVEIVPGVDVIEVVPDPSVQDQV